MSIPNSNSKINQDVHAKIQSLEEENVRLNRILSEMSLENIRLRDLLKNTVGQELSDQLLDLGKRNKQLSDEIIEKTIELDDLRQSMDAELIDKLKAELEHSTQANINLEQSLKMSRNEIEQLKSALKEKHDECDTLRGELENLKENSKDEERVRLLLTEVERLNLALSESNAEIKALRRSRPTTPTNRSRAGDHSLNESGTDHPHFDEAVSAKLLAHTQDTQEFKQSNTQRTPRGEHRSSPSHDFMSKINFLTNECEKLAKALAEKTKEALSLKNDNEELKSAFVTVAKENENLKSSLPQLKSGALQKSTQQKSRENENDLVKLAKDHEVLKSQVQDGQSDSNRRLLEEVQALQQKLKEKIQENDHLKGKIIEIRNAYGRIEDIQNKALTLADENERLNNLTSELQKKLDEAHQKIGQPPKSTQETHKSGKLQPDPDYENKLALLESENSKFERENKTLKLQVRQLMSETKTQRDMLNHWEKEAREALNAKGRLHSLLKENEEVHHLLNQKQSENEALILKIEALQNQQNFEKIERSDSKMIEKLQSEIDHLKNLLMKATNDQKREQALLANAHAEIDRLVALLHQKDHKLADFEHVQGDFGALAAKLKQYEELNIKLREDNENLYNIMQKLQTQIETRDVIIKKFQQGEKPTKVFENYFSM